MNGTTRIPVAFLPHGSGPWPIVKMGLDPTERQALVDYLRSVASLRPSPPRALLVVSAQARACWTEAPAARLSHPYEEHLIPLMVVAGAAGLARGTTPYNAQFMGVQLSAFHFG